MDVQSVCRAYRRYAPVYDLLFGPVMRLGRIKSVNAVNRLKPSSVLEVGVGTGLSLPHYHRDISVVGIDISPDMLRVAKDRVCQQNLQNVSLHQMNAEALAFEDASFDVVVAMYVMSVAPNPPLCLKEMRRVCKPGGTIIICNHFRSNATPAFLNGNVSQWLGWRPDFTLEAMLADNDLSIIDKSKVPPLFTVLECRN